MSFLDTLDESGIEYKRSVSDPSEINICCLFCEQSGQTLDTRFRLGVNIEKDVAHCFNCEWRSRDAMKQISEALGVAVVTSDVPSRVGAPLVSLQEAVAALPEDFVLLSKRPPGVLYGKAWRYLMGRGVAKWQIEEKKIGVSFVGQNAYRIIFPIYYDGELHGTVARDFTGKSGLPYLNSAGNKSLYNATTNRNKKAVLCEGVFDCLAIEQITMQRDYDVMAVLGRSLTELQERQLEPYRDIVLWPDADLPGIKGFTDIAKQLALRHRVFMVAPFGYGKDASSMTLLDRRIVWMTRCRFSEAMEMRLRAEVAFGSE